MQIKEILFFESKLLLKSQVGLETEIHLYYLKWFVFIAYFCWANFIKLKHLAAINETYIINSCGRYGKPVW